MNDRVECTGFEKAFIESWGGWDELDTAAFFFYDAKVKDILGLPTDVFYGVSIDLNKLILEVFDIEGAGPLLQKSIELKLS